MNDSSNDKAPPADWLKPLGADLPGLGPGPSRLWLYIAAVLVVVPLLLWGTTELYHCLFPPRALAQQLGVFDNARSAALAWRNWYAVSPQQASKAEIWKVERGVDDSGDLPNVFQYLLVQPIDPGSDSSQSSSTSSYLAQADALRSIDSLQSAVSLTEEDFFCQLCRQKSDHLYQPPHQHWQLSLQQLSLSRAGAALGDEMLGRGTLLVRLLGTEPSLVVSSASPPSGHVGSPDLALTPFEGCLPALGQELSEALLATPMRRNSAGQPEEIAWLARQGRQLWVFRTGPCGPSAPTPRGLASQQIDETSVPLLTQWHSSPQGQAFVLLLPPNDHTPPRLMNYGGTEDPVLVDLGPIDSTGIGPRANASSPRKPLTSPLVDSFDRQLKRCSSADPPAPARFSSNSESAPPAIYYLLPEAGSNGRRWNFQLCADPDFSRYQVLSIGCDDDRKAEALGQFVSLTPAQKRSCRSETGWRGCIVRGLAEGCIARVEAAPCQECSAL